MLKKILRVKNFADFKELFDDGEYFGDKLFYIKYKTNIFKFAKISIVVPKKVEKLAVNRNRIRRKYGEIIRLNYSKFKSGFNYIIIIKEPGKAASSDEILNGLDRFFKV